MTVRVGRPGMAPSPNQETVLHAVKEQIRFHQRPVLIDEVHAHCARNFMGGFWIGDVGDGEFKPWSRSTVRDHMNDLVLKAHLKTVRQGRSNVYTFVDRVYR